MNKITVTLSNPYSRKDKLTYTIIPYDTPIAVAWTNALYNDILKTNLHLEKNYCFLGFPYTHRNLDFLCLELNRYIGDINNFNKTQVWQNAGLDPYIIEEWFCNDSVRFSNTAYKIGTGELGLKIKHDILNRLHNHFERLQGTVWKESKYFALAPVHIRFAIRQLNNICHEMESLILSQRKINVDPEWVRPSQITTFLHAPRHYLEDIHYEYFNRTYDRKFGEVYMHWCQIGKTLIEVFRDESAPDLTVGNDPTDISTGSGATCEAINSLRFFSGEFDIEWGKSICYDNHKWHRESIDNFYTWLNKNNVDVTNNKLALGYAPIGHVELLNSFGTDNPQEVWKSLGSHLNIHSIEYRDIKVEYNYCWTDVDYEHKQIKCLTQ